VSSSVTLRALWRCRLAMQSIAVSPPPDHHNAAASRSDGSLAERRATALLGGDGPVAPVEVVHREVHSLQLTAGDRQIARHARAGSQDDGREAAQ
jgi:hypothetical protein